MKRNTEDSVRDLLGQAHANRPEWTPTPAWRRSVMDEIRAEQPTGLAAEFNRLAPRFTFGAAAVAVVGIVTAVLTLGDLPSQISMAYANQSLDVASLLVWI